MRCRSRRFTVPLGSLVILVSAYAPMPRMALAQQTPTYRLIAPDLVVQGESFTGVVVEETASGYAPLTEGDRVVFQGQVVAVEKGGIIKFPAFIKELGNTFLVPSIIRASGAATQPSKPHHVEVVPTKSNVPTKIAQATAIISPRASIRVTGQGLGALETAALVDADGKQIDLGRPVGSSLQQIYFAPKELPKGTYRLQARDATGNSYEAPNQTKNPTLQLSGPPITHRGQRGQITVLFDADGTAIISGGEPQILLDQRMIHVRAGSQDNDERQVLSQVRR